MVPSPQLPSLEIPHELTVCVVVREGSHLSRLLEALDEQNAPKASYDVVLVDATRSGAAAAASVPGGLSVSVVTADPSTSRSALLNLAWQSASGPGVAMLGEELVPAFLWVDALQRALRRGRRLVSGNLLPHPDQVGGTGVLSVSLWATGREVPIVSAEQMACLRAELDRIGGWDETDEDADVADTRVGARLVDAGVDMFQARHAVAFHDVEPTGLTAELRRRRRRMAAIAEVLDEHPRARARMLVAGTFWRPRHAEVLMGAVGAGLAARDRRWGWLAAPWVHERTCLAPRAGGPRRRWLVLPGVLLVDVHDAVATTALRLRPRRPR